MYTVHRRDNKNKALEDEKGEKNAKTEINGDKKDVTKDVTHIDEKDDREIKVDNFKQMSINETLDSEIP